MSELDREPVEVRRLQPADLGPFQAGMPAWNSREYAGRLDAQARGLLVQEVAWSGDLPVGSAMLVLPGHPEWSIMAHRENAPEVRDVKTGPEWRRRGVAKAVMLAVEGEARCHMHVPPQLFNLIQRNEQVILCPNCQRMLYWRPEREEEANG